MKSVTGLLLGALDAKHLRAAIRADPLDRCPAVLHRHFLSVGDFLFRLALYAITFSHSVPPNCAGFPVNFARILVAAPGTVKRQKEPFRAVVF
jgi:hypothetical protein